MKRAVKNILKEFNVETQEKRQAKSLPELEKILREIRTSLDLERERAEAEYDRSGRYEDEYLENLLQANNIIAAGMRRKWQRFAIHEGKFI